MTRNYPQHIACIEPDGLENDEIPPDNYITEGDRITDTLTGVPTGR